MFSRRARPADLGAARLGGRGSDRAAAPRESRPRPRPVACVPRVQSRKNRVGFAGDPSGSAVPGRLRKTRSAIQSLSKKTKPVNTIHFPHKKYLLYEIRRFMFRKFSFAPRTRRTRIAGYTAVREEW